MPNGWVHATVDLVAFGFSYFDLHQAKDKPYEILGSAHRMVNHEWYQAFGKAWTLSEPFPSRLTEWIRTLRNAKGARRAEEEMASAAHDYLDKIWDGLSDQERKYREGFFAWLILNPQILKDWAGVDVLNGRISRLVGDQQIWEDRPAARSEYERLRRYAAVVVGNNPDLQDMLERYG